MSTSRESTSLKKSSSDRLKLAKQWYRLQHFEWNDAISELLHFFQVVQKH